MFEQTDYRFILKSKFEQRCAANPRYSLRAFARDLEIAPSRLSEIFHGKQGLSEKYSAKVAKNLGLSESEQEYFINLVASIHSQSPKRRQSAETVVKRYEQIQQEFSALRDDAFRLISDWYHYALLELTLVRGFKSDTRWIAKRLGISPIETENAIDRLLRLDLLRVDKGRFIATGASLTTTKDIPSEAIRNFNRQLLSKASQSLETQSVNERDVSSLTFVVDTDDIPIFKESIKTFRRRFHREATARAKKNAKKNNEVYALGIQFFRLTNKDSV